MAAKNLALWPNLSFCFEWSVVNLGQELDMAVGAFSRLKKPTAVFSLLFLFPYDLFLKPRLSLLHSYSFDHNNGTNVKSIKKQAADD